jgi:hypothetical protein
VCVYSFLCNVFGVVNFKIIKIFQCTTRYALFFYFDSLVDDIGLSCMPIAMRFTCVGVKSVLVADSLTRWNKIQLIVKNDYF